MLRSLLHDLIVTIVFGLIATDLLAQEIRSTNGGGNWSAAATWVRIGTGPTTPQAGDLVIVTPGNPVVLDTSTPSLARLEIHASFSVQDTQARSIVASRIDVGGPSAVPAYNLVPGSFVAGSAAAPFQHQLTIELTNSPPNPTYYPLDQIKETFMFVVHGSSTLQLHGKNTGASGAGRVSWAKVSASVPAGATSMTLAMGGSPGWNNQDHVVISSTNYDMMERELVTVASSAVGGLVTFGPATVHPHHGVIESGLVDERAEVGLLTHNIRVFSVPEYSAVGAQGRQDIRAGSLAIVGAIAADVIPTLRLDYVEFYNLGWKGAKGRYPIHIHELGDVTKADFWVRNCSIHHCFNRAIAIHGTHGVTVDRNVMCDTIGHSVYLEDRSERDNVITNNLVLVTRVPTLPLDPAVTGLGHTWGTTGQHYFCEHDREVSSYWITNTSNDVIGNVAAGSQFHGFWYDVSTNGNDPPFSAAHNPCKEGFGTFAQHPIGLPGSYFSGNVAHSNGKHGFYCDSTRWLPVDLSLPVPLRTVNLFESFTAYKNRDAGIWNRGHGTHIWRNARLADNRLGVYFGSEGNTADGVGNLPIDPLNMPGLNKVFDDLIVGAPCYSFQLLDGCFIIGVSGNNPSDPQPLNPWAELVGVALYDGVIYIRDTQFSNFLSAARPPQPVTGLTSRVATAVTTHTSPSDYLVAQIAYAIDSRNAIENCDFVNCSHEVLFPNPLEPLQRAFYTVAGNQLVPWYWLDIDGPNSGTSSQPATYFGNAVDNVVLLDVDGCLQGSFAGAYHIHESPLMRPAGSSPQAARQVATGWSTLGAPDFYRGWAKPLMFGGPGTLDNQGVAQFRLRIPAAPLSSASGVYQITVNTSGTRTETRRIFDQGASALKPLGGPTHADEKLFHANILLTKPGAAEETYHFIYPSTATPPAAFQVRLQFGPSDPAPAPPVRTAVFQIPYPTTPPTSMQATHHLFSSGTDILPLVAPSLAAFQLGQGMWYHDASSSSLWLRMWCTDLTALGLGLSPMHPVFSGREMTIDVQ